MSPLLFVFAAPFFIVTFLGEAWLRKRRGLSFDTKDGARSVGMGVVFLLINLALQGVTFALFQRLYEHRFVDLGDAWYLWPLALVANMTASSSLGFAMPSMSLCGGIRHCVW